MQVLMGLLSAQRKDLLDGFPVKAVLASFKAIDPLAKLNELLRERFICVKVCDTEPCFVNPHLLKYGIISAKLDDVITIHITSDFFGADHGYGDCKACDLAEICDASSATIVAKALMFQSVCLHQLMHKARGSKSCSIFYKPAIDTMNDDIELEAIAAGLVHDLQVKSFISITGLEALHELSPRLASMLSNARAFAAGSLLKLQNHIKRLSEGVSN